MPGETGVTCRRVRALPLPLHTRLAGASGARHSLRPLFRGSRTKEQTSRKNTRRDREVMHGDLPSLHAPLRVAGRGRGGGGSHSSFWGRVVRQPPPPPAPPPPLRGGGEEPLLSRWQAV